MATQKRLRRIAFATLFIITALQASAQSVALKNNLLYDATLTPNLGLEVKTGSHSTVQLFYGLHPWQFSDTKKLRHWSLMPEWRHWTSDDGPFRGWFYGIHLVGGEYNVAGIKLPFGIFKPLADNHYEGWYAGGGLTLGHAWPLSQHWRLEAAIGLGYIHTKYKQYENVECGDLLADAHYNYFGPTKLALNLVWVLGGKKPEPVVEPVVVEESPVVVAYEPHYQLPFFTPQVEAVKSRDVSGRAYLDFPVNKTVINRDYRNNGAELAKVEQTINAVRQDPNLSITHISIHGYASPEGSYQSNERLAEGRAAAFKDYVRGLIDLPASLFSTSATAEDWQGLRQAVSESTLEHRTEILALIDSDMQPDPKEQRIRRLYPADYRLMLSDIYPALRHSDYVVNYTVRAFTAEEGRDIIKTKPQQLSLNEMFLVAQTYPEGSFDYNEVFLTAVRLYPADETANLNAAIISLQKGDREAALHYLAKAGQSAEAQNARGVLSAQQGDRTAAEAYFRDAQQKGLPAAQHNQEELSKL